MCHPNRHFQSKTQKPSTSQRLSGRTEETESRRSTIDGLKEKKKKKEKKKLKELKERQISDDYTYRVLFNTVV